MSKKLICKACNDTGLNSKGAICHICHKHGRQPMRSLCLLTIASVFSDKYDQDILPTQQEITDAVEWVFAPPIIYHGVMRFSNGTEHSFGQPTIDINDILKERPWERNLDGTKVMIVEERKSKFGEPPERKVVAKVKNEKWMRRKN